MNLEKQVVSLELSKRLRELGVRQESLFAWNRQHFGNYLLGSHPKFCDDRDEFYSAYSVAELGEMLPVGFEDYKTNGKPKWNCTAPDKTSPLSYNAYEEDENESNMRAKMLIYLIKNNLVKVGDL